MKKNIVFGLLISCVCIYFAFRGIDFAALSASLASVNYLYIIPVVLIVAVRALSALLPLGQNP